MFLLFAEYRLLIGVLCGLLTVSIISASYCYLNARTQAWYHYLWKGFSLMSIGCVLILLGITLNIPEPLNVMREVVVLPLGIYGFSLIVLGERKKRSFELPGKDELTERIARSLSKAMDPKESQLYS